MANTYTQIYYHIIFAVRNRESLITESIKEELYKYISGIINNQKQKLLIINGMPDHIHILINCKPNINLSNLVKEIKEHSTKFINDKKIFIGKFYWQTGFSAFSISNRDIPAIINYIKNQENHHGKKSFKEEYLNLLKENDILYDEEYVYDFDLK